MNRYPDLMVRFENCVIKHASSYTFGSTCFDTQLGTFLTEKENGGQEPSVSYGLEVANSCLEIWLFLKKKKNITHCAPVKIISQQTALKNTTKLVNS